MKPCTTKLKVLKIPSIALGAISLAAVTVASPNLNEQTREEQTITYPAIERDGAIATYSDACNATISSNGILAIQQRRTQSIAGLLDSRTPGNTVNAPLLDLAENFSVFELRALRTRAGTYLHRTSRTTLDSNCEVS